MKRNRSSGEAAMGLAERGRMFGAFTKSAKVVARSTDTDNVLTFGKTISLIVEIRPNKSVKQILEAQHYICAGCYKHFDDGKTQILDFVQTLGWGKPRLCEYTGQLFCSSCHTNETCVLPARVLHHWDFAQYPVSQLAKSYLDSIYDQELADLLEEKNMSLAAIQAAHESEINNLGLELEKERDKLANIQLKLQEELKLNESFQEELNLSTVDKDKVRSELGSFLLELMAILAC
ncbi:hypothetical protein LOK49_LG01G03489 [Camellia lanceoleosa]|uniref:Uncharacterized protein n=1 Tax=Camellia lanceoleosa TaxID=1840588 RepID=A0ACC0J2D7_9ERIC|nr:hypothetical protein LOK49_LG01G03489 [Camellia lanceoleosa]